jgi:hypothetical protein
VTCFSEPSKIVKLLGNLMKDDRQFRELIVWLENQKIRLYKVEDREAIDDTENINWPQVFSKVIRKQ